MSSIVIVLVSLFLKTRVSRPYGYYEVPLLLSMSFFFGSLVIEIGKQHYCYNYELECDQESCVIGI